MPLAEDADVKTEAKAATSICTAKMRDGSPCREPRANQDENATNRHCRTHQREAQRRYLMAKFEQDNRRAIRRGISLFREHIAENFARYKSFQRFTGEEIAGIIRAAEVPADAIAATESPAASTAVENVQNVA